MRYKLLGRSGLRVSELALGTMTFGEDWGWGASYEASQAMFDAYLEAGGNFIDTSVNYTNGSSEEFVGRLAHGRRDSLVLATKYSLSRNWDDVNAGGNSRKNLRLSVETSLRRLQTDYIDLLWLHMWDHMTPADEVMRGMDDLVRAGKVLYLGISDTPAWIVSRLNTMADLMGWSPFVCLQVPYSLASRDVERELLPMARSLGLAVTPWGIIGGGVLSGKYTEPNDEPRRYEQVRIRERTQQTLAVLDVLATETGSSKAQIAAAWIRQQQPRAQIIPILGARNLDQLSGLLKIIEINLTDEQLARLDEVSRIEMGFPHDFLNGNVYLYGNTFDKIDNHHR